jgi:hypothetical protein
VTVVNTETNLTRETVSDVQGACNFINVLAGQYHEGGDIGAAGLYFDPSAWARPSGVTFGNTRRNQFRGPGGWT